MRAPASWTALWILAGCRINFDPLATGDGSDADYAGIVLADQPTGYWRLGESSGPIARDELGLHDGVYSGTCAYGAGGGLVGDANTAVVFDGVTCAVDLGDNFARLGNAPYSIEAWIRLDALASYQHVFTRQDRNTPRQGYGLVLESTGMVYHERFVNDVQTNTIKVPTTIATYMHVVGSYDSSAVHLYLDGTEAMSIPSPGQEIAFTASAVIGSENAATLNFAFHGAIDEVAFYDRALTSAEIVHHRDVGRGL